MTTVRVTRKTARLLRVFLDPLNEQEYAHAVLKNEPDSPVFISALELMRRARLSSGSLYPLLDRLESNYWIRSEKEELPAGSQRPARRFYGLTEDGAKLAQRAVEDDDRRLSWWQRITGRTQA